MSIFRQRERRRPATISDGVTCKTFLSLSPLPNPPPLSAQKPSNRQWHLRKEPQKLPSSPATFPATSRCVVA
ncbi:hypothetical protein ACE6H2_015525 [Prunus campanulata]